MVIGKVFIGSTQIKRRCKNIKPNLPFSKKRKKEQNKQTNKQTNKQNKIS